MIEEARIVTVHARIDDSLAVDDEQKRMTVVRVLLLVATIRFVVGDGSAGSPRQVARRQL